MQFKIYKHCRRNSQYFFAYWDKYTLWSEYFEKWNRQFSRYKPGVKTIQSSFSLITLFTLQL